VHERVGLVERLGERAGVAGVARDQAEAWMGEQSLE
jgi:hypothetical protein